MALLKKSEKRAASARSNGAKSKGPITPEGIKNSQTGSLQHGLYAKDETLLHTVDPEKFEELRAEYHQIWTPENRYIAGKVDDLAAARWQLQRLTLLRADHFANTFFSTGTVIDAEIAVTRKGDLMERLEARIRRHELAMSRLERDILRLKRYFNSAGPSHNLMKTQEATAPVCPEMPPAPAPQPEPRLKSPPC